MSIIVDDWQDRGLLYRQHNTALGMFHARPSSFVWPSVTY
jgi:hypothetical protein